MKRIIPFILSFVVTAMVSCGGEEMKLEEFDLPQPEVTVKMTYGSEIRINHTLDLDASWNFESKTTRPKWKASNENISFSSLSTDPYSTIIKGVSLGPVTVTAEVDGHIGSIDLEVLPLADFKAEQTTGKNVQFTYVAYSYDFDKAEWNYGDGSSTETKYSVSKVSHTYAAAGTYNVSLKLYKKLNLIDSYTKPVTVE